MDPRRSERVAQAILEELQEILNFELDDPRIGDLMVTEVVLSPDGRRAVIQVTPARDANSSKETLQALQGARRHIRSILMERIDLFRCPELIFELSGALSLDPRLPSLLRRIRKGRPAG